MFDFDWSVIEKLPRVYNLFKDFFNISKYDSHLNKFWFRYDYHEPQSISFADTLELLDQVNILISNEATFDEDLKKCYRNTITLPDTVIVTSYFDNIDNLHQYTTQLVLPELEKKLISDELRGITISRFNLSGLHGLA